MRETLEGSCTVIYLLLTMNLVWDGKLDPALVSRDDLCCPITQAWLVLYMITYFLYYFCTLQQDMSEAGVSVVSEASTPERVFKVVFVGDSGVGKSSFIHRFCHDTWKPSFTATIGKQSKQVKNTRGLSALTPVLGIYLKTLKGGLQLNALFVLYLSNFP